MEVKVSKGSLAELRKNKEGLTCGYCKLIKILFSAHSIKVYDFNVLIFRHLNMEGKSISRRAAYVWLMYARQSIEFEFFQVFSKFPLQYEWNWK